MSVAVLHDEFGFGEKRCQRYMVGIYLTIRGQKLLT